MVKSRRNTLVALTLACAFVTLGIDALIEPFGSRTALRTSILEGREVVEGEVIVRYRDDAGPIGRERAEFQAAIDGSDTIGRQGARRLRSRQLSTQQMIAALRSNPAVQYVEPNYVIRANAVPNDAWFGNLWGLLNTGQNVDGRDGVPGADINAVPAWDITTGSRTNIVAILDTGIDATHPDLAANIFTAPRQFTVTISGAQLTCPAGTRGFNAMLNTCNAIDDNGHGTHVAGIIGAVGNNGIGVTGINWTANVLPLKVLDSTGTGTTTDAIEAIEFAIGVKNTLGADGNIRILNASWGGGVFSQALNDAIQAANNKDMLFVASAGSGGNDNDVTPHYPASSAVPNVISVAAVDNTGQLASYSNYGASSVHLAAPGDSALSTKLNGSYDYLGGTSIAAPFVSGTAALLLTACPSNTATLK
ncbi:MAG TPA: S8 family peptidase, partial [Vicinamibacterales bacterium]